MGTLLGITMRHNTGLWGEKQKVVIRGLIIEVLAVSSLHREIDHHDTTMFTELVPTKSVPTQVTFPVHHLSLPIFRIVLQIRSKACLSSAITNFIG